MLKQEESSTTWLNEELVFPSSPRRMASPPAPWQRQWARIKDAIGDTPALYFVCTQTIIPPHRDTFGIDQYGTQMTRPVANFQEVREAGVCALATAEQAELPDLPPGWKRIPKSSVRTIHFQDLDGPEWEPLDYKISLAVKRFYEQDDANTGNS
jgi:hypothetical protein